MDILTIIILIVILVLIISYKGSINQKLNDLEFRIMDLQNLLKKREQKKKPFETPGKTFAAPFPVKPPAEVKPPEPTKPMEIKLPVPPKPAEVKPEPVVERHKEVISDSLAPLK